MQPAEMVSGNTSAVPESVSVKTEKTDDGKSALYQLLTGPMETQNKLASEQGPMVCGTVTLAPAPPQHANLSETWMGASTTSSQTASVQAAQTLAQGNHLPNLLVDDGIYTFYHCF